MDTSWVENYPEIIDKDWYYFDHNQSAYRQRRMNDYLEIQSKQDDRWITIKYLSLEKETA